jgi:hypothetical protein
LFRHSGKTEVRDAHLAAAVDHDIAGFQVTMQNATRVRRGKARAYLAAKLGGFVGG